MRLLTVQLLAICVLTPLAFSAPVVLGRIFLYDPPVTTPPTPSFEKFGALHYVFQFAGIPANGLLFVLCDNGVDPTTGQCVNQANSDFFCVTNNQAGEGTVAMMSDLETPLSLGNIPPDFPCQVVTGGASPIFLAETGKPQTLSPIGGFPTILPGGAAGPHIKVLAQSVLVETGTGTLSDVLTVMTQ
jgi:hypothetical protein